MSRQAAEFVATIVALPTGNARLHAGLPALEALYRDLLRAAAPPNPQFERERIIAQASNPRELVFLFGLLSEGENEAALLLEIIDALVTADPDAIVAHVVDEAWYYLRTSIDPDWQLDEGMPNSGAALAYLFTILTQRLERLGAAPPAPNVCAGTAGERAALLRALREQMNEGRSLGHEDAHGKRAQSSAHR